MILAIDTEEQGMCRSTTAHQFTDDIIYINETKIKYYMISLYSKRQNAKMSSNI